MGATFVDKFQVIAKKVAGIVIYPVASLIDSAVIWTRLFSS